MTEFNNRIDAQREILNAVNRQTKTVEELFGLSAAALGRWSRANQIPETDIVLRLLTEAAAKLFLLANKSQEQVTEEYQNYSREVRSLTQQIRLKLQERASDRS